VPAAWTPDADARLLRAVLRHGSENEWQRISRDPEAGLAAVTRAQLGIPLTYDAPAPVVTAPSAASGDVQSTSGDLKAAAAPLEGAPAALDAESSAPASASISASTSTPPSASATAASDLAVGTQRAQPGAVSKERAARYADLETAFLRARFAFLVREVLAEVWGAWPPASVHYAGGAAYSAPLRRHVLNEHARAHLAACGHRLKLSYDAIGAHTAAASRAHATPREQSQAAWTFRTLTLVRAARRVAPCCRQSSHALTRPRATVLQPFITQTAFADPVNSGEKLTRAEVLFA
jgi:hypothetical protein